MFGKKVSLSLVVLLITITWLGLLGCAAKKAPDCSDNRTKEIVLKKIFIHTAYVGTKSKGKTDKSEEEYEKESLVGTNCSYSNNVLLVSDKYNPDDKAKLTLLNIRTTNIVKDIGKYECAAEFTAEKIRGGSSTELLPKKEISYTSELADNGKKHFVVVTRSSTDSF
ncbi:MAG: hypothetical protein WA610_05375 [Thermodesulfovibrionales bacterium]